MNTKHFFSIENEHNPDFFFYPTWTENIILLEAEKAAREYYTRYAGNEDSWPITFFIFNEKQDEKGIGLGVAGDLLGSATVHLDFEPIFTTI